MRTEGVSLLSVDFSMTASTLATAISTRYVRCSLSNQPRKHDTMHTTQSDFDGESDKHEFPRANATSSEQSKRARNIAKQDLPSTASIR